MTRKIAIVTYIDSYDRDYGDSSVIAQSITDWQEVTDSEFEVLRKHFHNLPFSFKDNSRRIILEQYTSKKVVNSVTECVELAKKIQKENDAMKAKAAAAAAKRAEAKKLTEVERKRKQLEKLKKELGETQ